MTTTSKRSIFATMASAAAVAIGTLGIRISASMGNDALPGGMLGASPRRQRPARLIKRTFKLRTQNRSFNPKPHQGAQECERRRRQMKTGEFSARQRIIDEILKEAA